MVKNRPKPNEAIEPSHSSTGGGRPSDGMEIDVGPVFSECEDRVNITGNEPGPSTRYISYIPSRGRPRINRSKQSQT